MKLAEIKRDVSTAKAMNFKLQNGTLVLENFHITEDGIVNKHYSYINCGGKFGNEKIVNFQLWDANDFEHGLKPQRLPNINGLSEKVLGMEDFEIEVAYQTETIGKYDLAFNDKGFVVVSKQTACLASDACATPQEKQKLNFAEVVARNSSKPSSGCC
jgi:Family of unknown function (DUF6428)